MNQIPDLIIQFSSVFLGIFIEAAPFLLIGTVASGLVEVFFSREDIIKWIPRQPLLSAIIGSLVGLFIPVCECGVIPLTRRLYQKGAAPALGISFMLAAPVLNPIVLASTYTAFGIGPIFWGRIFLTMTIAITTAFLFSKIPDVNLLLIRPVLSEVTGETRNLVVQTSSFREKMTRVGAIAGDEFFEMGKYLVMGAMLASFMQILVPQSILAPLGKGPVISVVVLGAIAVILSVCSTVDALVALAFVGQFSTGAILAFLVYGPMIDIKSTLMLLRVFRKRIVFYLVMIPLLLTLVITTLWNLISSG